MLKPSRFLRSHWLCERRRRVFEESSSVTVDAIFLAEIRLCRTVDKFQAKYAEAELLCKRSLDIIEQVHGPNHSDAALVLNNWATVLEDQVRAVR